MVKLECYFYTEWVVIMDNIPIIDINDINLENIFLHYTSKDNIYSIFKNGLEPRIGENAKGLEQTKKVFFTIGEKNALIIMDVWLKWLMSRPKNKYIYRLGAYFMKQSYFPKFIYDVIFKFYHESNKKFIMACDTLKEILDNSCYLVLGLEENVDYDFEDVDEVKKQAFPRRFLKGVYKYNSDLNSTKMEYWNMHTYSNKVIEPQKIKLLKFQQDISAEKILKYLIDKNFDYVKENLELLYKYYNYIYQEGEK